MRRDHVYVAKHLYNVLLNIKSLVIYNQAIDYSRAYYVCNQHHRDAIKHIYVNSMHKTPQQTEQ